MIRNKLFILLVFLFNNSFSQQKANNYDVVVYGGTSAGVIAAYTAKKMGNRYY
jgi:ribulose 1,5-bisphosphate synthetase/thiazole synthase